MWKYLTAMLALGVLGFIGRQSVRAQTYGSPEQAAVAKAPAAKAPVVAKAARQAKQAGDKAPASKTDGSTVVAKNN